MPDNSSKLNLFDLDRKKLERYFADKGEASFRAAQTLQWLHQRGRTEVALWTNMGKKLREQLAVETSLILPEFAHEHVSADGTYKWVVRLADGNRVETVYIPEKNRGTLCVSSQVGCALNCSFCSTGKQGFNRNLTVSEIIGQVWLAARRLSSDGKMHDRHITNVVMMGMGEPLLNFDNVVTAMNLMMDDFAYGLSKRRVTLSTSGIVPAMEQLSQVSEASLAVSLHAPNDALRDILVPINKKYPLAQLIPACKRYFSQGNGRSITMEYVMLAGINDSLQHARELIKLLAGVPVKVNLIPFNPFPFTEYRCSALEVINAFAALLNKAGIIVTVRKTRGDDIDAACGQLVGKVADRTQRARRWHGQVQGKTQLWKEAN